MPGFIERRMRELIKSDNKAVIDNILCGKTYYRKTGLDYPIHDLSYYLTVLDDGSIGFAYYHGAKAQDSLLLSLVDRCPSEILKKEYLPDALKISILDAGFGYHVSRAKGSSKLSTHIIDGGFERKAAERANLIARRVSAGDKVLLVGFAMEIVVALQRKKAVVAITDKSNELPNNIFGTKVLRDDEDILSAIKKTDICILTGAVFTSGKVDSVIDAAKSTGTRMFFYLETGSNFAPALINEVAEYIVAENFPFYDFPGPTKIFVYESTP